LHGGIILLILTMFDAIMIVLVWREFQVLRQYRADEKDLADQNISVPKVSAQKSTH